MNAPTLSQQIEAVEWAAQHCYDAGKRAHMRHAEIEETRRRLEAAVESLKTMEFARETLR